MVTIKDVAKLSGVGVGTVSRVLNGSSSVKKETVKKVINSIKKLNYKPNPIARKLASGYFRESTIGIVIPNAVKAFFFEILKGIYQSLNELNYNILIFNVGDKHRKEVFTHVIQENLYGILVIASNLSEEEKELFEINNIRYIYIEHYEDGDNSIFIDNKYGGELVAEYFAKSGNTKIGYVGETRISQQQSDRFCGFKEGLKKYGLSIFREEFIEIEENILYQQVHDNTSYEITKKLINEGCDGIFFYCDELAYGGIKAKQDMNSDIKIVGYDDLQTSSYFGLTTVKQPAYEIGYESGMKIVELIKYKENEPVFHRIKPELVLRNT